MPQARSTTLTRYARLDKEKRKLEDQIKRVKAEIVEAEPMVLDYFQKIGGSSVKIGNITIYMARELWASKCGDVSHDQACAAMRDAGLNDYTGERLNTQSLSAYVRELDAEDEKLPEALDDIIKVSEVFKIRTRKAS